MLTTEVTTVLKNAQRRHGDTTHETAGKSMAFESEG